jgi:L-ascorbate metabolism protein UlaG (beta-lactamase superfamily)
VDIHFLGHACFELTDGDTRVLIDPFLTGNPKAAVEASEVEPTHIFLTHGHADHWGDVVDIAKRTGAQCVAIVELADELGGHGIENVADPNLGGTVEFEGGWVRLVPAWHTSTTPGGTVNTPAGLVINLGGRTIYHLGDTALFSDLRLVGERDELDAALVCIGGHYTMDRHDAVQACELIGARTVVPCHYGTFPPIETDDQAFKADVERRTAGEGRRQATVEILDPGSSLSL